MSKLAGLTGTPWHITYLKSNESGRRDRRSCKFYINNNCSKGGICYGGRYCTEYEKRSNKNDKLLSETESKTIKEEIIEGCFSVKFYDDIEPIKYEIGKNISKNAPLINIVLNTPKNGIFEINGEKGTVIDKNLKTTSHYINRNLKSNIEGANSKRRYDIVKRVIKDNKRKEINKDIVEYGDIVRLLCIDDNKEFELEIRNFASGKEKSLIINCRDKRIYQEFKFYGKKYKILEIRKDLIDKYYY